MIRWVVVIFIGLTVFYVLLPGLARLGVGRMPADVRFRIGKLIICLPFGSTVLWSALAFGIAEALKYLNL